MKIDDHPASVTVPSTNSSHHRTASMTPPAILDWDDVQVTTQLGSGAFCSVYRILATLPTPPTCSPGQPVATLRHHGHSIKSTPSTHQMPPRRQPMPDTGSDSTDDYSRSSYSSGLSDLAFSHATVSPSPTGVLSKAGGMRRGSYALKRLGQTISCPRQKELALESLAVEAAILSHLPYSHSHIIALHGISRNFWLNPSQGFLVMEELHETLASRIRRWKARDECETPLCFILSFVRDPIFARSSLAKREKDRVWSIGLGLAAALAFLRENKVLHRDLKPDNIGFDFDGNVKLFDFSLARTVGEKEESDYDAIENGNLTLMAGTARYMAPEVRTNRHYGFAADVYSFAMVLWEVCSLEKPFAKVKSVKNLNDVICSQKKRPALHRVRSPLIRDLLNSCWSHDPSNRLSANQIISFLRDGRKHSY